MLLPHSDWSQTLESQWANRVEWLLTPLLSLETRRATYTRLAKFPSGQTD